MDRTNIYIVAGLLVAAFLAFWGHEKAQPDSVERVFAQQIEMGRGRALPDDSMATALKEMERYVTFAFTEEMDTRMGGADQNQAALNDALQELSNISKDITERGAKLRRQGKGAQLMQGGLDFLDRFLQERMESRATLWYVFAGIFAFFSVLTGTLRALRLQRRTRDKLIQGVFFATALTSIIILGLIMVFLFIEGLPIFKHVGISDFLFGLGWYPTDDDPEFGIFPLIIGSLSVTVLSSAIAIPLGVMTALYLAEIASLRVRNIVKPIIELLASLPSVVIGFFGMVVVAPFLQNTFDINTGLNMFNASLMLAFMSVPTITSVSEDAIYAVPLELKEASLALGATHCETIWKVVVPASLSGISTAVILGMSRAIGETMVVLMVAGGAGMIPDSIFDPVRPMPSSIAAEMGEAPLGSDHYHALFAIGIVLFLFTMVFNVIADHIANKYKQVGAATL